MKFEKITDNKIRITLTLQDLAKNHLDLHSFMANSDEAKNLFFTALMEAEDKIGFETDNYDLHFEAFASDDGNFIITITRHKSKVMLEKSKQKRLKVRRKFSLPGSSNIFFVYAFDSFENFCMFVSSINDKKILSIAKKISLYEYDGIYYLLFDNINISNTFIKHFHLSLVEFSTYIDNSDLFAYKLFEFGKCVMKHNAIKTCMNYFCK